MRVTPIQRPTERFVEVILTESEYNALTELVLGNIYQDGGTYNDNRTFWKKTWTSDDVPKFMPSKVVERLREVKHNNDAIARIGQQCLALCKVLKEEGERFNTIVAQEAELREAGKPKPEASA